MTDLLRSPAYYPTTTSARHYVDIGSTADLVSSVLALLHGRLMLSSISFSKTGLTNQKPGSFQVFALHLGGQNRSKVLQDTTTPCRIFPPNCCNQKRRWRNDHKVLVSIKLCETWPNFLRYPEAVHYFFLQEQGLLACSTTTSNLFGAAMTLTYST